MCKTGVGKPDSVTVLYVRCFDDFSCAPISTSIHGLFAEVCYNEKQASSKAHNINQQIGAKVIYRVPQDKGTFPHFRSREVHPNHLPEHTAHSTGHVDNLLSQQ